MKLNLDKTEVIISTRSFLAVLTLAVAFTGWLYSVAATIQTVSEKLIVVEDEIKELRKASNSICIEINRNRKASEVVKCY